MDNTSFLPYRQLQRILDPQSTYHFVYLQQLVVLFDVVTQ